MRIVSFVFLTLVIFACRRKDEFSFTVSDFRALSNFKLEHDSVLNLEADLSDAVLNGIIIPTKNQCNSGYFTFSFKLKNTSDKEQRLYYKLFYQNETYAFPLDHEYAAENFYGSWEDVSITYKVTPLLHPGEEYEVIDSLRIVGNPRDEKIFYGPNPDNYKITEEEILKKAEGIKNNAEWMKSISEKAKRNKLDVNEQVYRDALWAVNYDRLQKKEHNLRQRRNPRMGDYRFYLLCLNGLELYNVSQNVKHLDFYDSVAGYKNPLYELYSLTAGENPNIKFLKASSKLSLYSQLNLSSGVFVDRTKIFHNEFSKANYNFRCGEDEKNYRNAHFEQYFHHINRDFPLKNIPVTGDVTGDGYLRKDYEENLRKYSGKDGLIDTYVNSSDCPCKTVQVDTLKKSIKMINPGNKPGEFKKEHVGVRSRIGFTYGKFIAKVKFPELINKENVWNGITNAFWLLVQDGDDGWNNRRPCRSEHGYLEKHLPDNYDALPQSKPVIAYSEIDFEILKESQYWPKLSYQKANVPYKQDDAMNSPDIMVTCTNWDMACQEPKNFRIGAWQYSVGDKNYLMHRWDYWYKALTTKIPANDDELFKRDYYYFEIDWQPTRIIWRIGPEENNLRKIAEMTEDFSSIPNNQMMILFTQEWHNQEWWPTAPYKQNFVPFPKSDIIGEILEVKIK